MRERLLWGAFILAAAAATAGAVLLWLRAGDRLPKAPDFRVTERSGRPLARRDLLGEVWIADFVFARCPTACPSMNSAVFELGKRFPGLRFVTFTVDPDHDTPEYLKGWVDTMGLSRDGWYWGSGRSEEEMQSIARGFLQAAGRDDGKIVHSERFVLVDRYGRIRGTFPVLSPGTFMRDKAALEATAEAVDRVMKERAIPVASLPAINAGFNGTSFVLLLAGFGFIKTGRRGAHRACMLAAVASSTLFLVGYLTAHHYLGSTPFTGQGWVRPVYFSILLSHTVLAALIVPLAGITLVLALRERFPVHRRWARWTLPLWLYVSLTGVVIYFMLYG